MGDQSRGDNRETIGETIALGGRLFVLEDRLTHRVIGTSWLTLDGRRIYLHHFGIDPRYQGKGYSGLLLKVSLDHARSTGLQIKLEVHKDNELAEAIYIKAGFKYLGDYKVYIIRDYNSVE
jgi:ribosomal protein S18 acetylase RimI-like enzyme